MLMLARHVDDIAVVIFILYFCSYTISWGHVQLSSCQNLVFNFSSFLVIKMIALLDFIVDILSFHIHLHRIIAMLVFTIMRL